VDAPALHRHEHDRRGRHYPADGYRPSGIERFNRFYGDTPIKLFDGANGIQHFAQVPFDKRLEYRNMPGTFVYDEAAKTLYLNGTVQFAGTLYIDHIKDSPEIENSDSSSWIFPSWAHRR
jgi:hypothetical protein